MYQPMTIGTDVYALRANIQLGATPPYNLFTDPSLYVLPMDAIPGLVAATGVLSATSCAVSLAGIALIVWLRGYKHFHYRLTLHLAVANFMRALSIGASAIPVDIERSNNSHAVALPGTDGLCAFFGGCRQYTYLWCAATIMWTCAYMIRKGCWPSKKRGYEDITDPNASKWTLLIKRHRYEIAGHITVVLLPALVFWIPYVDNAYGINGPWCWVHEDDNMHDKAGLMAFRFVFRLPVIIGTITCVSLMTYIMCKYVRRARLQDDQWQLIAVRKVGPVMVYPITFAIASLGSILHSVLDGPLSREKINNVEMVFLTLFFIYDMSIPLSLFLHKDIRLSLSAKCASARRGDNGIIQHTEEEEDKELIA